MPTTVPGSTAVNTIVPRYAHSGGGVVSACSIIVSSNSARLTHFRLLSPFNLPRITRVCPVGSAVLQRRFNRVEAMKKHTTGAPHR
jgi:hypothetical protein